MKYFIAFFTLLVLAGYFVYVMNPGYRVSCSIDAAGPLGPTDIVTPEGIHPAEPEPESRPLDNNGEPVTCL